MSEAPVLEVEDLVKHFHVGPQLLGAGGVVRAVDDGSLTIRPGELAWLVGESSSGNSTVGPRLVEPTGRTIRILGTDVTTGAIVGEPLRLHGIARRRSLEQRVVSLFEQVGLRPELRHRYPHELSGRQCLVHREHEAAQLLDLASEPA
jgi:oligopeptide transport system ATP-binding protein